MERTYARGPQKLLRGYQSWQEDSRQQIAKNEHALA
jgi:hypothetical protein